MNDTLHSTQYYNIINKGGYDNTNADDIIITNSGGQSNNEHLGKLYHKLFQDFFYRV